MKLKYNKEIFLLPLPIHLLKEPLDNSIIQSLKVSKYQITGLIIHQDVQLDQDDKKICLDQDTLIHHLVTPNKKEYMEKLNQFINYIRIYLGTKLEFIIKSTYYEKEYEINHSYVGE